MSWKSTSTKNPALLLRAQIPRSNVGQVAHVSATPQITSQKVDIMRRTSEAAWWLWLGCWSNNFANSRPCPSPFNSRALRSCLVPQCSYPYHWPCHQSHENRDWMPASYTRGQTSCSCRHPTCWASSQRSCTFSSTPWRGTGTPAPLSAHLSSAHRVRMHGISNRDIHLCSPHNNSSVHLITTTYVRRTGRTTNVRRSGWTIY